MYEQVSRLLGLEGFAVTGVEERGRELELVVELVAVADCCPRCGRASCEVKERPVVRVRDLAVAGRRTFLRWRKRRFRCRACSRTFSERHPELPARQRVTRRFRGRLFELAREGAAHAELARTEQTSRYQVGRAFALGAAGALAGRAAEQRRPRRLCLDEAHHRRGRELVTVVSDPDRKGVIEVLEGRSRRLVEDYLRALPDEQRSAIEAVSIDPYEGYRQAVRAALPEARVVCDPFHLIRGANDALDTVRRQRQRFRRRRPPISTEQRRDGFRPQLFRARRRLLKARERLSDAEREQLHQLFRAEPELAEAWLLKEAFRAIYRSRDRGEAELRLARFLAAVERAQIPSFSAFAKGLQPWREELLAYFEEPLTNGYAEGVINKVKVIKRRAYGVPSFSGFRSRILVACG
jgi:transposase